MLIFLFFKVLAQFFFHFITNQVFFTLLKHTSKYAMVFYIFLMCADFQAANRFHSMHYLITSTCINLKHQFEASII